MLSKSTGLTETVNIITVFEKEQQWVLGTII